MGTLAAAIAAVGALACVAAPAHADSSASATKPSSSSTLPSEAPLPSCLDKTIKDELGRELRPRGVQKREFLKDGHLELVARGGLYSGDLTSSSWVGGGALAVWFTEDLAVQASFDVTPVDLDLDKPLAGFFGDDRFEPGMGYLGLASLLWSPVHAKLKMGDGIVHADVLVIAGAGRLFHDSVQGLTFEAGIALELFTTRWFTLRFETRDVMAVQEAVAETRFTNNIVTTAGLAFWLPVGL